jgi:serine protease
MRVILICAVAAWLTACGGGGGGGTGTTTPASPPPAPVAPEADAGANRTVMLGSTVNLDGRASSDPDGTIFTFACGTATPVASFAWTQTAGPMVTLINADQAEPSFTAPDEAEILAFELTVTDNDGLSASDSVTITVVPQTFSISGVISVAASTDADSDVNDTSAECPPNDTPADAQSISNPVTLGGYVNSPGAGEPGRSQSSGDVSDFYRVALVAGQTITLVAESSEGDVDLFLWNAAGTTILNSSISPGSVEQLPVPSAGEFLVEVMSFSGASNYILIIGQAQPSVSVGGFRLSDDFIPGDVILRYRDESMAPAGQAEQTRVESEHGLSRRAGARNRAMLMRFGQHRRSGLSSQNVSEVKEIDRRAAMPNDEYRQKYETLLALKALNREPTVAYAEPNYLRKPLFTPDDEFYCSRRDPISMDCIDIDLQWHYPLINLPAAWDVTRGANVTVAVIDTGVLVNHPDLENQLLSGYDFISDPNNSLDGDGIDPNPDDPGDGGSFARSSFHGSHVAGTVAAATDNTIGVAGVAGDARVVPLRVCGFLGCSSFDIIEAVRFAAGLPNGSGMMADPPVDVINLSLGGGSPSGAEQAAFDAARTAGVVTVAAAGNESTTAPSYPAAYQNVISVSAVGIDRSLASYSNTGSTIDVAAPGGDFGPDTNADGFADLVLSTGADDSSGLIQFVYPFFAGTSMASPHVAGVIALMKSVNGALTPGQIDQMLASGVLTDDLGAAGRDNLFGHGLINAQKAVAAASNVPGAPPPDNPILGIDVTELLFGTSFTTIEITALNITDTGVLNITGFSTSESWLSVAPVSIDAEGLGTYAVTVDRSGLTDGIYPPDAPATVNFQSDVNHVQILVIMQVSSIPLGSDAGFVYVLLLDAQTGNPAGRCDNDLLAGQCSVSVVDGKYAFTFVDVPPGDYQVVAGTDADNDQFICDAGEACGAYGTVVQPLDITVIDADLGGIDFPIGHTAAEGIGGQSQDPGASPNAPAGYRRRP